jgi:DNA invertase Pin-like site-specific DNA recombinase
MEQKKAWIYCRVAHNGPDSAEILERQRHRLESYAKEHGFEIVDVSSDIGSSLTMDRPGLLDFHAAADGGVDVLLLCNLDHLGRDCEG